MTAATNPQADLREPPGPARAWPIWCGVWLAALSLYVATANRGPQSQDSGWQQLRILTGRLEHPYGLPLYHPLHFHLGRLALALNQERLEPAFAITLVSSLAGAVAVANIAATLVVLTRRLLPTLIATCALLLSHTLWQHATHTESYALVAALLSAEWLCLACFVTRGKVGYLLALAFFNGLGLANHLLAGLATPVDLAVLLWAWRRRRLSGGLLSLAGALWLAGSLPYTVLVLQRFVETYDLPRTLHNALFAEFYAPEVLNTRISTRMLVLACGYVIYNFPGLTIPLAALGLRARRLPGSIKWPLTVEGLCYLLFVVRYPIADQYTFFFPLYLLLALLAGLGLADVVSIASPRVRRAVVALAALTAVWTPAVYVAACRVMARRGALASVITSKPYRDGYRTFFIPWGRGADHATRLNAAVRELVGDEGLVLVVDPMQLFGLYYAQIVGDLPLTVQIERVRRREPEENLVARWHRAHEALTAGRPVILVPRDRDKPIVELPGGHWERVGDLYRLVGLDPLDRARLVPED